MWSVVRKFFNSPFIFIYIIAQAYLRVNVITKQINICLILWTSIQRWELKKSFFNWPVVIYMNGIFEHVINEVRVWLNEFVQGLQDLQVFSLLLVEQVKSYFILIQFHLVDSWLQLIPLLFNHLFSFFNLLLLFLKLLYLLVNLLFHHLEQVLMLDLQLVHDTSETFLKLVHFFVKLFPHFHL